LLDADRASMAKGFYTLDMTGFLKRSQGVSRRWLMARARRTERTSKNKSMYGMSNSSRCRKAKSEEIRELYEIINSSTIELENQYGSTHWTRYSFEQFQKDFHERQVLAILAEGEIVGTVTVDMENEHYPEDIPWSRPQDKAIYITKLALKPLSRAGSIIRGVADWIEEEAVKQNCKAIRFDAAAERTGLIELYETIGFPRLERTVELEDHTGNKRSAVLFEKVIL
jgi:hypothetical protein